MFLIVFILVVSVSEMSLPLSSRCKDRIKYNASKRIIPKRQGEFPYLNIEYRMLNILNNNDTCRSVIF